MSLDLSFLPESIRPKAEELSKDIDFFATNSKGSNGYVLFGFNKILKRRVVVKFYYWGGGDHAEPALLASFNSQHILTIDHAESINEDDAFFMTPYCALGDLDDALNNRKFGPVEAIDVISQIAAGTSFLHGSGHLHRDLKPSNIFCVSENRFVIGDFGSVVAHNNEGYAKTLTKHSLLYRPPEEIQESRFYREGDIYQLGFIFYQTLGGSLPYDERDWLKDKQREKYDGLARLDRQAYATSIIEEKIGKGKMLKVSSLPPWTPASLIKIIRKCCAKARTDRYSSVADLTAVLNNIRSRIPDWRICEFPVLHRAKKKYRVIPYKGNFAIEKCVGTKWRREHSYSVSIIDEAIRIAETL
ncbi:protein kinase [Ferrovibrio sp. MS7]|uniref:serine/threonine protein kinase n=1 Tax=Ferrovibrio plantarum TaxID=3119164 RepID=UPI00313520E7